MDFDIIDILKGKIEHKIGHKLKTPTDFNLLSLAIAKEQGETVSVSTIKRIWGYVESQHQPGNAVLSILSRFAGYADWDSFRASSEGSGNESGFLVGNNISIDSLQPGDEIEFTWLPDRYCRVSYMGAGHFKVVEARNGRIKVGDTFCTGLFCEANPLYMTNLQQGNGKEPKNYVAGMRNGIRNVKLNKRK